ncbi:MAG: DNA-nicking Smr family endonuclease [Planctomycetota bacterium]
MAKKRQKRTSTNRYAHLADAQVELDFHTMGVVSSSEVKHATIRFITQAKKDQHAKARIITGKGIHSKRGPVVKPQVERTLKQLAKDGEIISYYPEKSTQGGDGAFVVTL